METGFIFVYGTLKVGGHFAKSFDEVRLSHVPATTKGTMYRAAGWFPGCVFGGENTITGELHEVQDFERVLRHMDYIEGCNPAGSPHNLYNRKTITVTTEDGREVEAVTYEFNRPVDDLHVMEDGIWPLDYTRESQAGI